MRRAKHCWEHVIRVGVQNTQGFEMGASSERPIPKPKVHVQLTMGHNGGTAPGRGMAATLLQNPHIPCGCKGHPGPSLPSPALWLSALLCGCSRAKGANRGGQSPLVAPLPPMVGFGRGSAAMVCDVGPKLRLVGGQGSNGAGWGDGRGGQSCANQREAGSKASPELDGNACLR